MARARRDASATDEQASDVYRVVRPDPAVNDVSGERPSAEAKKGLWPLAAIGLGVLLTVAWCSALLYEAYRAMVWMAG